MSAVEVIARHVHDWQALDSGHGKFTEKCVCNHHAREIASVLWRHADAVMAEVGLSDPSNERFEGYELWADGFHQGNLGARDAVRRWLRPKFALGKVKPYPAAAADVEGRFAPSAEPKCGAKSNGGSCVLPQRHNMGRVDIPRYHSPVDRPLDDYEREQVMSRRESLARGLTPTGPSDD